ncbi:MAG: endolytic transglycosylase MltG [Bryobacteraceae bacterium]|nr:endolytic transglycosylase MltG [Bryobacteraceae bacterium]
MRTSRKLTLAAAGLTLAAIAGAAWALSRPHRSFAGEVLVDLERGTSTREIAGRLHQAGVVASPWHFLAVRALRPGARLQAGEYRFTAGATPWAVFHRLARGDIHYYQVTVPEGANMFEVAEAVERTGLIRENDFLQAARNPAPIRDLAPRATSLEGYLFPSTYLFPKRTTAAQLARMMTDQFRREWKSAGGTGDPHQTVTLASLVEKETSVDAERKLVAGVYRNRLNRGMKLECDPTTIYAALLENRYDGVIHRSDLDNPHPYNTYRNLGLPPGPIANPGKASLAAARQPAQTDFIFFVAKPGGSGEHTFSADYAGHQRAVMAYRRAAKTNQAQ